MEAKLGYEQISALEEEKESVKVFFMKHYYLRIPKAEIKKISDFEISGKSIIFRNVPFKRAERKFAFLIEKYMPGLTNIFTGKNTVYVHKNSGIPLLGNTSFGIIYRNTNMIEVKPVTGCNLNCIYCSIDEGKDSAKSSDFLIEREYLVEEIKKLAEFIDEEWNCHIGTHGEPLIYPELKELIRDISKIKNVKCISMDTNAALLTEEKADELIEAGLARFNISIDSLDREKAMKMAGCRYNPEHVKKIAEYIGRKSDMLIAPVWVPGYNDNEIEKLIQFSLKACRKSRIKMGIQNFLEYERGRRPAKQMSWEEFYGKLRKLEKKHNTKLVLSADDFGIKKSKILPKPFKKGQTVKADLVCRGMHENEKIAAAEERSINAFSCSRKPGSLVRIKLVRDKHNCFAGKCL